MPRKWLKQIGLMVLLYSSHAGAAIVSATTEGSSSTFFAGIQNANFKFETGTVSGFGILVGTQYFFTKKIAGELSLSQIYGQSADGNSNGSFQSIGTAIQPGISYSFLGTLGSMNKTYQINGAPVVQFQNIRRWNAQIGLGFDQYWFNGTDAVYPASGVCYFISGEFPLWRDYWIKPSARIANLTSGQGDEISASQIMLSMSFRF